MNEYVVLITLLIAMLLLITSIVLVYLALVKIKQVSDSLDEHPEQDARTSQMTDMNEIARQNLIRPLDELNKFTKRN